MNYIRIRSTIFLLSDIVRVETKEDFSYIYYKSRTSTTYLWSDVASPVATQPLSPPLSEEEQQTILSCLNRSSIDDRLTHIEQTLMYIPIIGGHKYHESRESFNTMSQQSSNTF